MDSQLKQLIKMLEESHTEYDSYTAKQINDRLDTKLSGEQVVIEIGDTCSFFVFDKDGKLQETFHSNLW